MPFAQKELFGMPLPIVCRKDLVDYKRKLNRPIDYADIETINQSESLEKEIPGMQGHRPVLDT